MIINTIRRSTSKTEGSSPTVPLILRRDTEYTINCMGIVTLLMRVSSLAKGYAILYRCGR